MNKEEQKKLKEQQERREFIEQKYMTAREALLEACKQSGVNYKDVFAMYSEDFCVGLEEEQIKKNIHDINIIITELSQKFFHEKWINVFNESFSERNKNEILEAMLTMLKSEPAEAFLSYSRSYAELDKLCNNKQEEALYDFEEFSSRNTLEKVINTYGMTIYSKFNREIIDAFLKGFNRNKNVDPANISAYFVGSREL